MSKAIPKKTALKYLGITGRWAGYLRAKKALLGALTKPEETTALSSVKQGLAVQGICESQVRRLSYQESC